MKTGSKKNSMNLPIAATTQSSSPLRHCLRSKRAPIMRQFELIEAVKAYDPTADEALLNRAYVFSVNAHGTQKRANGDPYFSHPIEVAGTGSVFSSSIR